MSEGRFRRAAAHAIAMAVLSPLMLAGLQAQTPEPAPAPAAPPAPPAAPARPAPPPAWPVIPDIVIPEFVIPQIDLSALQIEINAQMKSMEKELARLNIQVPVPPVPPVPPKEPTDRRGRRYPDNWVEATEPYSQKFPVGRNASLVVVNVSGTIQVTAGAGDSIEVQATKRVHAPTLEDGKRRLGEVTIEAYATGNRVELRAEYGNRRGGGEGGLSIDFTIKVPGDGNVDLRSVSGDVRVTNVKGEVRTQTVSGNIALDGTPRLAAGKAVSGDIQISNAGADTQLSLSTVSGDLTVQGLNARGLDVNTVSGDVRLGSWTGDRANIRTLSGHLDVTGTLSKGGRFEVESHSGDVRLALPEQPGFELDANTFSGRVQVDFSIKSEGPIRSSDRGGPRSIRGTYGDASSSLRIQTFSGDITVTKR